MAVFGLKLVYMPLDCHLSTYYVHTCAQDMSVIGQNMASNNTQHRGVQIVGCEYI